MVLDGNNPANPVTNPVTNPATPGLDNNGNPVVPSKGDPRVISDTQGEEITPDNPEIVKHFPVGDTKEAVQEVEGTGK